MLLSTAVHQAWLHAEQMTLVPSCFQTMEGLTSEERMYKADFGMGILKGCLRFEEVLDLKHA